MSAFSPARDPRILRPDEPPARSPGTPKGRRGLLFLVVAGHLVAAVAFAQEPPAASPGMPSGAGQLTVIGRDVREAVRVADRIYYAPGFGNTFLVVTDDGNVVVDTSLAPVAPRHRELLRAVSDTPVRYIILTHGHGDHTGGVGIWKEPGTEVIEQRNAVEFLNYQNRLRGFFQRRNAAQFGGRFPDITPAQRTAAADNYGAVIPATILFDEEYAFELGGLRFELLHTPGETYDHLTVWIPALRAAFVGDNFYGSFPNLYTLRGTKPRWALDYVESIDRVLALEPEIVLPSHGPPVIGGDEVREQMTRYRDALLYVHDATVAGMNAGRDVFTLMREIHLPAELEVGEGYGSVAWTVRGIYEGYAGWYDGRPASMYAIEPAAVYPDLVELAGGPSAIAARAAAKSAAGDYVEALHLSDVALAAVPDDPAALRAKLGALEALLARSTNSNERGWLEAGIYDVRERLTP